MKGSQKQNRNKTKLFYLFSLALFFFIFVILVYLNYEIKKQLSEVSVNILPLTVTSQDYPMVSSGQNPPVISAKGAVVIDNDSKVPIYLKNPNLRFLPASTTKIMTALVALDHYKLNDPIIINETNVGGAISEFQKGERFTFEDMLYAMLLPSNNDATLAISQSYPGGEREFVRKMNEKAEEFLLKNTRFVDPVGIEDGNYTTPVDLARLTSYAIENPLFSQVVSTEDREIESLDGNKYFVSNLNELLDIPGVNGVKTGFTESAGEVLVTTKKLDNIDKELIFVVMRSEDRFLDTKLLLDYLSSITYQTIHP